VIAQIGLVITEIGVVIVKIGHRDHLQARREVASGRPRRCLSAPWRPRGWRCGKYAKSFDKSGGWDAITVE